MRRNSWKKTAIQLTALSLLLAPGYTQAAVVNNPSKAVATASTVKAVRIENGSAMSIRDAKLLMQDKGLVLSYTVTVTNNGTRTLDLLDYWIRLKGKGGKIYKPLQLEADKQKKTVAPGTSVNLTYYCTVENTTKITDLVFEFVKWDFSMPNYERKLGTITNLGKTVNTPIYQGGVMLFDQTKIKGAVKQMSVTQESSNLYLNLNFLLENIGWSGASLATLGFAMVTESNSVYDLNAQALAQTTLQPRDRKIVSLQIKLPSQLKGKKLTLVPYLKNDTDKIKLPLGAFALSALTPSEPVKFQAEKVIYLDGQQVKTKAEAAEVYRNDADQSMELDFVLTNEGETSLKMPSLDFSVLMGGKTYPLTYTKEENAVLLPNTEKKLRLSGTLPGALGTDAKLVVRTTATDTQESYLVSMYQVQSASSQGNGGSQYVYKKDYSVSLDAVYREAMDDSDAIVAALTIKNTSSSSVQVPSALNGYFMINGVKVSGTTNMIGLDQQINIAPNESYHMAVYTKIPYTTSTDSISFVLTEAVKDSPAKSLFRFADRQLSPMKDYQSLGNYDITDVGSKASVRILSSNIYQGDQFNYFYSEFEVTNQETRMALIAQLGGYVQDNEGRIATIKVSEVKDRIMPNGKVLVYAWGVLGKSFNVNDYGLVFGKMVQATSGTPTDGGNTPKDAIIVNPVRLAIQNQAPTIDSDLIDMKISAYALTLKKINTRLHVTEDIRVEGLKLTLDYDLNQIDSYDYVAPGHKILIEFVDQGTGNVTYSKEYVLGTPGEGQTALKQGKDIPLEIVFNDPDIQKKISVYNTYKLNVYDVVENAKMLIGSKEMRWFTPY